MPALNDSPALITGAGRGIGRAIAERLALEGAAVTLLARTQTEIDAIAAGIGARGGRALALACDVTQPDEVATALATAAQRFGPIRVLVNNAGTPGPFGPIGVLDPQQWWASQHLHQYAPLLTMSALIPAMQRVGGGRIINIVSSAGTRPVLHMSGYALGKCAAIRLTETVDLEQRANGIRAFALQPGTIITDMAHATMGSAEAQRWIPEGITMLRGRTPQQSATDLARCCAVVAALAAGQYDGLAGRYLDIAWDLDALLREVVKTP
ncbi:MAG TPA: SDR family oxidoreductase [Steroidobacteraceae bacterium]|jgi:NAD(P)-dependent dehydrogenase (short-subunit alcohol dehydrogenase family)